MSHERKPQDRTDEARKLLGVPSDITLGGRTVTVRSYGWMQLFQVLSAAQPIIDAMAAEPDRPFTEVVQAQVAHVNTLMALSTGLTVAEIEALPLADGLTLAYAVWAENADFFVRELTPMLVSALASKTAKSSSSGIPTSSQDAAGPEMPADGPALPIA